jgi:predicted cupin superfamily sugar epimerase
VTADELVAALHLQPHPEGGHFVETWRDQPAGGARGAGTAIYFLLRAGEESRWHRVDAAEIWHHYAGAPLELEICNGSEGQQFALDGDSIIAGPRPGIVRNFGAIVLPRPTGPIARQLVARPLDDVTNAKTPIVLGPRQLTENE